MPTRMTSLQEVIDYAKEKERTAKAMYETAARKAHRPGSKKLLTKLAQEEASHEQALDEIKAAAIKSGKAERTEDLHIAEYLEHLELKPDADYQSILIFAMKREEASRDLYDALAETYDDDEELLRLFDMLAAQEEGHKRAIEEIYDEDILREN